MIASTTKPVATDTDASLEKRVRYTRGQMLNETDFTQEQNYHLNKSHQHNRILHGYGTVSGLEIDAAAVEGSIEITVNVGVGVDRAGRVFRIATPQCADLLTWLDKHPDFNFKNPVVYVVACYDETLTDEQYTSGQDCLNDDVGKTATRIQDSVKLELRAQPPKMPLWQGSQNVRDLMAKVQLVDAIAPNDDRDELIRLLLAIDGLAPLNDPTPRYRLDSAARDVLEEIYRLWVVTVLPKILAEEAEALGTPEDYCILLGAVRFNRVTSGGQQSVDAPIVNPDGDMRPVLLHTQLFQGFEPSTAADLREYDRRITEIREKIENLRTLPFVTITPLGLTRDNANVDFELWFHTDIIRSAQAPSVELYVELAGGIQVVLLINLRQSKDRPPNVYTVSTNITAGQSYDLRYLRFVFPVVQPSGTGKQRQLLQTYMSENRLRLEGYESSYNNAPAIVVYVRNAFIPSPPVPPAPVIN
jgi:hypothetical protein